MDAEKNGRVLKLIEVLEKTMREEHVYEIVKKAYQTIECGEIQTIMGFENEAEMNEFVTAKGLIVEGGYVHIPQNLRGKDEQNKRFHLS